MSRTILSEPDFAKTTLGAGSLAAYARFADPHSPEAVWLTWHAYRYASNDVPPGTPLIDLPHWVYAAETAQPMLKTLRATWVHLALVQPARMLTPDTVLDELASNLLWDWWHDHPPVRPLVEQIKDCLEESVRWFLINHCLAMIDKATQARLGDDVPECFQKCVALRADYFDQYRFEHGICNDTAYETAVARFKSLAEIFEQLMILGAEDPLWEVFAPFFFPQLLQQAPEQPAKPAKPAPVRTETVSTSGIIVVTTN